MDHTLTFFIQSGYTDELRDQIYRAFKLLEEFDFPDLYSRYHQILGNDQLTYNADLRDSFLHQVNEDLRFVGNLHSVEFIDGINLLTLVDLTEFFMTIQHLVDYDMILSTMESSELTDEEMLVEIMNEYTGIDHSALMEYIESFNPKFLEYLKLYAMSRQGMEIPEVSQEVIDRKTTIVKNITTYRNHIDGDAVGVALVELGVLLDQPFDTYYSLVRDDLQAKKPVELASDIVSLSIICQQQDASPTENFRKVSEGMRLPINTIVAVEQAIATTFSAYNAMVKVV